MPKLLSEVPLTHDNRRRNKRGYLASICVMGEAAWRD
jgi:hypothetical protein